MAVIIKIFKWVFIICLFITLISFTSVSFNKDEFSISKIHIDSIKKISEIKIQKKDYEELKRFFKSEHEAISIK